MELKLIEKIVGLKALRAHVLLQIISSLNYIIKVLKAKFSTT